jgi:predicted nuclease of predicted toxin-antitoxin system
MSRPRFLADNDLNDAIVRGTLRREPSIEFTRLRELGLEEYADRDVLAFAARQQWIVVSHDVNSMTDAAFTILRAGAPMHGLLLVHQRDALAPTIESLILIWSASEAEEWIGLVEHLPL